MRLVRFVVACKCLAKPHCTINNLMSIHIRLMASLCSAYSIVMQGEMGTDSVTRLPEIKTMPTRLKLFDVGQCDEGATWNGGRQVERSN